jgi:NAD(P)-dependent dehydrogenase (short-subunit alcohol dehydrogenase family)
MTGNDGRVAIITGGSQGIGAGLAAATRSLAVEYASRGVRVNAVSPGIIQTPAHPPDSYDGLGDRLPRSGGPARSATSSPASCSWSHRLTSPARSCTSTADRSRAARPTGLPAGIVLVLILGSSYRLSKQAYKNQQ